MFRSTDEICKKWGVDLHKKLIFISGPYTHGTKTAKERKANLDKLNHMAVLVLEKGYIPIVAMNLALPIVRLAKTGQNPEVSNHVIMQAALVIAARCDGLLRLPGESDGAEDEVALMQSLGKPIYYHIDHLPEADHITAHA